MNEFIKKIEAFKQQSGVDLSIAEDLSIAVMNLIGLEEHFFFTGVKTGDDEYFNTSNEIRQMRKELLAKLMPHHEGETWCASKHLLSASMRLIEVGNKLQSENKKDEAKKMFEDAHKIYLIFWALKTKLIDTKKIKETTSSLEIKNPNSHFEDLLSKLADCCNE